MADNTNPNIEMYGAKIVQAQLEALLGEIEGVRTSDDIEYVHRMRVATRRMRAVLPIFGPYLAKKKTDAWSDAFRKITKALGSARDLDVQLEKLTKRFDADSDEYKPGLERMILRWKQRREKAQKSVVKALDEFQLSGVAQEIAAKTAPLVFFSDQIDIHDPALMKLGVTHIRKELSEMLKYDRAIQDPANVTELHEMRIQAKRLRYSMETFAPLFPNELASQLKLMKSIQDLVGETHDADVWIEILPKFIEDERKLIREFFGDDAPINKLIPGIEDFLAAEKVERDEKYAEFIELWEKTKKDETWQKFFALLQESLEPPAPPDLLPETAPEVATDQ